MNPLEGQNLIPPREGPTSEQMKAELAKLSPELRQYFVFVDIQKPEIRETLEIAAGNIDSFLFCIRQLNEAVRGLGYYELTQHPEARRIGDMVSSFTTVHLRGLKLRLERALQSGVLEGSIAVIIDGGRMGVELEELKGALSKLIYSDSIDCAYDKVLIALETLRNLDYVENLNADDRNKYAGVWKQVQPVLEEANKLLTKMGIEPVDIKFFARADERTAAYVTYLSLRPPLKEYYPNSPVSVDREFVLGAISWAYLKPDKHLWQGVRAQIIVSE